MAQHLLDPKETRFTIRLIQFSWNATSPMDISREAIESVLFETASSSWMGRPVEIFNASIQRLEMDSLSVEVVLAGSVFKGKGSLLPETAANVIHTVARNARLVRSPYEPVVGAALLALEAIGISVGSDHQAQLTRTLPCELHLA